MKIGEHVVVFKRFPENSGGDATRQLLVVLLHPAMFVPEVEFALTAAKLQGIPLVLVYVGSKQEYASTLAQVAATTPAAIATMHCFQQLREAVAVVDIRDRPSVIAFVRKCQADFWTSKSGDVRILVPPRSGPGGRRIML
jgi:hypothetical protein